MPDSDPLTRHERTAAQTDAGLRLDQFWARELAEAGVSRERAKDWIRAGQALVEGKVCDKPGQRLEGFERLGLDAPSLETLSQGPQAEAGELAVIHRDADLLVVDKPAGLTTHPAPSQPDGTLVNRLLAHFPEIAAANSGMEGNRPGIVHRLDKDTSGLIAVALNEAARLSLAQAFAARAVAKTYLAILHGRPKETSGSIETEMGRHPTMKTRMAVLKKGGRPARTDWKMLWSDRLGRASLVAVRLHTGRTHQIRVHMAHMGHPLVGDAVYGSAEHARWLAGGTGLSALAPRQMLHAFRLKLRHPVSGEELDLRRDPPADFMALLAALGQDCLRVVLTGMPGCGKSTLGQALANLPGGPAVFSADVAVAELYAPGGDGAALLSRRFGRDMLLADGSVDRSGLLAAMRAKESLRREVEEMIHPLVEHRLREFWSSQAQTPLAVAEIPLFLETGGQSRLKTGKPSARADVLVGVTCPDVLRRGPLRESRGLDPDVLDAFDSWQWPEADKLAACDLVVENAGTAQDLASKAAALLADLERIRAERSALFAQRLGRLLDTVSAEPQDLPEHADMDADDEPDEQ